MDTYGNVKSIFTLESASKYPVLLPEWVAQEDVHIVRKRLGWRNLSSETLRLSWWWRHLGCVIRHTVTKLRVPHFRKIILLEVKLCVTKPCAIKALRREGIWRYTSMDFYCRDVIENRGHLHVSALSPPGGRA
jgi:hypothetical protein